MSLNSYYQRQLDQRLTNPLVEACSALEVYSALSVLPREGRLHDKVNRLLERNLCDFNNAINEIETLGEDAVIVALIDYLGTRP